MVRHIFMQVRGGLAARRPPAVTKPVRASGNESGAAWPPGSPKLHVRGVKPRTICEPRYRAHANCYHNAACRKHVCECETRMNE